MRTGQFVGILASLCGPATATKKHFSLFFFDLRMIPPKSVPQEMNISGMDIVSIVWHDTAGIDMDCHDFFRKSQKGFAPQFSKWHNTTSVNCLRFLDRVLQTWFGQSDQSFTSCPHLTWQIESLFGNLSKSASKPWNAMVPRFHRVSFFAVRSLSSQNTECFIQLLESISASVLNQVDRSAWIWYALDS